MTRIIAGAAGSLRLEVPKSGTRPTSDRVREAVFSALESWDLLQGSRVLDLYAGSGALGLESASRGASEIVLVEKHAQAAQVAMRNTRTVLGAFRGDEAPRVETVRAAVQSYLDAADPRQKFDVILLDPPYDVGETELAANLHTAGTLLAEHGVLLVERSRRSPEPSWPEAGSAGALRLLRERAYGETVLWWAELTRATTEN